MFKNCTVQNGFKFSVTPDEEGRGKLSQSRSAVRAQTRRSRVLVLERARRRVPQAFVHVQIFAGLLKLRERNDSSR